MRTTFYENKKECIVVIDDIKKIDEYSTVVDLSKIKDVLKGLSLLGKEVRNIGLDSYVSFDVDTKYYHRYDENFLNGLYRFVNRTPEKCNLTFKNNRLFVLYEDKEIICPIDMCDSGTYSNPKLTLVIEYK